MSKPATLASAMPTPDTRLRAPHTSDVPCRMVPGPDTTQTWDAELAERLIKAGEAHGIDQYDPVVAMAEMAMDPNTDERIKFNCHKEVAKYVRLKRQVEPVIGDTINVYNMPPQQRRRRIEELTLALAETAGAPLIMDVEDEAVEDDV